MPAFLDGLGWLCISVYLLPLPGYTHQSVNGIMLLELLGAARSRIDYAQWLELCVGLSSWQCLTAGCSLYVDECACVWWCSKCSLWALRIEQINVGEVNEALIYRAMPSPHGISIRAKGATPSPQIIHGSTSVQHCYNISWPSACWLHFISL